ncbi:hypothetical protein PCK2_000443 [Pneumocystis canis]|nr:hypothetical protein PCK2_000443 [Pneumocystis canis]
MKDILIKRHKYHSDHYDSNVCEAKDDYDGNLGLRISSIFVIMIFSAIGVFFPLIITKIRCLKISQSLYYFIKFLGTGIIIGTAFVHLLQPAFEELGSSPCLTGIWKTYNFSPVLCITGVLAVFFLELFSLRYIHFKCIANSINSTSDVHTRIPVPNDNEDSSDVSKNLTNHIKNDPEKQNLFNKYMLKKNLITFFIFELGIIFHSIIIGFTLAVTANKEFITLYIVTCFHRKYFL